MTAARQALILSPARKPRLNSAAFSLGMRALILPAALIFAFVIALALILIWLMPVPAHSQKERSACAPGVEDFHIREEDAEKWDKARAYLAQHGVECFGAAKNVWTCVRKCD